MKEKPDNVAATEKLPEAKITRKRNLTLIWLVPIFAGAIAGWLIYKNLRVIGPTITIRFADAKGIQAGKSYIRYRGVPIGEVRSVELSKDPDVVEVKARLKQSAAHFARDGSRFWVVRPDVALGSLRGLDTIVGGPYIQAQPGNGAKRKEFTGLEKGPVVAMDDGGLDITLTWPQLGWLNVGAPVYYRGVEVGVVQDFRLGDHATNILIQVHVRPQFAPLVRENSLFWNAGGIKADLNLFGVSVSAESLKSMLVGGIAFATPSTAGPLAREGTVFQLHEKADDKWLKWSPSIAIESKSDSTPQAAAGVESIPTPTVIHSSE